MESQREGLPRAKLTSGHLRARGKKPKPAIIVHAPQILSFEQNHDEMLGFIRDFQFIANATNATPGFDTYVVDLAEVTDIDLDAALVLVAEYHRTVIPKPGYRPTIDDAGWPTWLRCLLQELGFYALVQAASRSSDRVEGSFDAKFVPFISAAKVEGELVDELIDRLKAAAGSTPKRIATYGALLEAIKNVRNHAYPLDADPQLPPRVERWWGAGAYFPKERTLAFAMFDQGVGIPFTLPRRSIWQAVIERCPAEFTDADLIEGAIDLGRTSTGLQERGNGLWTICSLVEELPGSVVRILSGRGELVFSSDGGVEKKRYENPFCGTLIEWSLVLPSETLSGAVP